MEEISLVIKFIVAFFCFMLTVWMWTGFWLLYPESENGYLQDHEKESSLTCDEIKLLQVEGSRDRCKYLFEENNNG